MSKISEYSSVTSILDTDEFILARSGNSYKVDAIDLANSFGALGTLGPFPAGDGWWSPVGSNNGIFTPVLQDLYISSFFVYKPCTVTGMGVWIVTAPSSDATVRFGLWDNVSVSTYMTNNLLIDTGNSAGSHAGSSSIYFTGLSQAITPGMYHFGYVWTNGTTLTNCMELGGPYPGAHSLRGGAYHGTGAAPSVSQGNDGVIGKTSGVTGALPDPLTTVWQTNSNSPLKHPHFFLKVTIP